MKSDERRPNTGNVYEFTPEGRRRPSGAGNTNKGRPSKTSIILGVVCVVLFIICIVLMVLLVDAHDSNKTDQMSNDTRSVCLTEECVASAARISSSIDHKAQPCSDFYQFACGRWVEENVVPDDQTYLSFLSQFNQQINVAIKNSLEADTDRFGLRSFREAQTFYKSCMNETRINSVLKDEFKRILVELGGLPLVTPDWYEKTVVLNYLLTRMSQLQTPPFLDLAVGEDPDDITKKVLHIKPVTGWYLPNIAEGTNAYAERITKMIAVVDNQDRQVDVEVYNLHVRLNEIAKKYSQDQNRTTVQWSTFNIGHSAEIDWKRFVHDVPSKARINIPSSQRIVVQSLDHIREVVNHLNNTNKRILVNFMLLNFMFSFANTLGDRFQSILSDQETMDKQSVSDKVARYQFCIEQTTDARAYAIATVFIKQKFDNSSRAPILELTKEIRTAVNENFKDIDWLSDKAKKIFREKTDNMSTVVGYPNELAQNNYADMFYPDHKFDERAFFNNSLAVREETFNRIFKQLQNDRITPKLPLPYEELIGYHSDVNQLYASAALLQPPIFAKNYPKYLTFGNLGFWFAINIFWGLNHSLETHGKSIKPGDPLYGAVIEDRLLSKIRCFENQLHGLVDPETGLKFNRTHSNFAYRNALGTGVFRIGYKAYKTWQARQDNEELRLPGLNYTQDQLFFLTMAQKYCSKTAKQIASSQNMISSHFKVNAFYRNIPEFAQAFKCAINSGMHPSSKCAVWGKI